MAASLLQDRFDDKLCQLSSTVPDQLRAALQHVLQWPVQRWPVYLYMACTMICLLTSSLCHLFGCCSRHTIAVLWRLDYMGITLLIVASFYPQLYYGFMCSPAVRNFYLAVTTLLGVGTLIMSLMPTLQSADMNKVGGGWQRARRSTLTHLPPGRWL